MTITTPARRLAALVSGVAILGGTLVGTASGTATAGTTTQATSGTPAQPELLTGDVTDLLVQVRSGAVCSGTPIAGQPLVVTAAHCVLDRTGHVATHRTVVRDGVTSHVRAIIVDERYAANPSPALDAAVLVLDAPLPGPGARLASGVPTSGDLTLAGYQPLDTDGSLLRGTNPEDRPTPAGAGAVVEIRSALAGCTVDTQDLTVRSDRVDVPCGLIPGASGGALVAARADGWVLHGVVSTVNWTLDTNGVTPVSAVLALLADRDAHTSSTSAEPAGGSVHPAAQR